METKNIDVNGETFCCPITWTVKQARERIRARYGLQGGGIDENNIPVLGTVLSQVLWSL